MSDEESKPLVSHTFVGAVPEDVATGQMVSTGSVVGIDPTDPHNEAMIERGVMIPTPPPAPKRDHTPDPTSSPEGEGDEGVTEAPASSGRRNRKNEEGAS